MNKILNHKRLPGESCASHSGAQNFFTADTKCCVLLIAGVDFLCNTVRVDKNRPISKTLAIFKTRWFSNFFC